MLVNIEVLSMELEPIQTEMDTNTNKVTPACK